MKISALLPLGLLLAAGLPAQDLKPAPLVWLGLDDNPDELPVAKGLPTLTPSADQSQVHEPGYVEFRLSVTAKGEAGVWASAVSSPWLPKDWINLPTKFVPAKRSGSAVPCEVALYYVYNPAEADPKRPDASPRLLSVLPPVYPEWHANRGSEDHKVKVRVEIDEKGQVTAVTAPEEAEADFADAAKAAVKRWTFASARKAGLPVAATLETTVLFSRVAIYSSEEVSQTPKAVVRNTPLYPYSLARAGIGGKVAIEFEISVEGRVHNASVIHSTHKAFEDAALQSIRGWRFIPAQKDGRPVSIRAAQLLEFEPPGTGGRDDGINNFRIAVPKAFPPNLPEELRFEVPPRLEYMETPVYPLEDLVAHRKGKVTLAYVVDPEGKVSEVSALPGATTPAMAAAATVALERFRFTPPGRKGKPCHALLRIDFEFDSDGITGHVPVTEGTKRALHILTNYYGTICRPKDLDQSLHLRKGPEPQPTGRSGQAVVEFIVDPDGVPRVPKIVSASDSLLGYAAVQKVSGWRFFRPVARGKYVDVLTQMTVDLK